MSDPTHYEELTGQAIDNYIIEKLIGLSGQAVVFLAHGRGLPNIKYALKLFGFSGWPANLDYALSETQNQALLDHPGVVKVYRPGIGDVMFEGREHRILYIPMQYAPLGNCQDRPPYTDSDFTIDDIKTIIDLLDGLNTIHEAGLLHRDLNPANILRFDESRMGRRVTVLRIADFGIAKVLSIIGNPQTFAGLTPAYMPPEQPDHHYSVKGDIYSMGATLFYMITGFNPIPAPEGLPDAFAWQTAHRLSGRPNAADHNARCPARLASLIMQMMSVSPDERPTLDYCIAVLGNYIETIPSKLQVQGITERRIEQEFSTVFASLRIHTWRQIEQVDIKFHPRLTVLTGANGSGKTTILNLISGHFGWAIPLVATPKRDKKSGHLTYVTDFWKRLSRAKAAGDKAPSARDIIGEIVYDNLQVASLSIPANDPTFVIEIQPLNSVAGLHIPSHRPIYNYQKIPTIPTEPITRKQAFDTYFSNVHNRYMGGSGPTANFVLKETLLTLATFGYGNKVVLANPQARDLFEQFQSILKKVLPPKLGFQEIEIEMPEVLLRTRSGNFSLDGVSGGIAAIIDIAWQIFMYSGERKRFVVTIDEPENHLHPELQRTILVGLLEAFPQVQFIVATHNPFIISSVPNSSVYVLDYNSDNKVQSKYLDFVNKAGSANEILRDVLGLPFTMPIWAEERIESIVRKYSNLRLTDESFSQLRIELSHLGLEKLVPDTIAQIVEGAKGND